jgi:hypothetical protein
MLLIMLLTQVTTLLFLASSSNRPSNTISFISVVGSTSDRLHWEIFFAVYFIRTGFGNRFCSSSGVDHPEHKQEHFRFRLTSPFYSHLKLSKVGILVKVTTVLCINLQETVTSMTPVSLTSMTPLTSWQRSHHGPLTLCINLNIDSVLIVRGTLTHWVTINHTNTPSTYQPLVSSPLHSEPRFRYLLSPHQGMISSLICW